MHCISVSCKLGLKNNREKTDFLYVFMPFRLSCKRVTSK